MSTTTCGEWNEFAYFFVNNKCILGNNQSRALISGKQLPEIVIIPQYVNGHPVLELGVNSLSHNTIIREIVILARITQINYNAMRCCTNLEKINIPSSCLYIFDSGIHMFNSSMPDHTPTPGVTNVIFEPNSKIQYIDGQGISYRETINIFFCSPVKPILHRFAFSDSNPQFFSPYNFWLSSKTFVHSNVGLPEICYDPKMTCKCVNKYYLSKLFSFIYVLIL